MHADGRADRSHERVGRPWEDHRRPRLKPRWDLRSPPRVRPWAPSPHIPRLGGAFQRVWNPQTPAKFLRTHFSFKWGQSELSVIKVNPRAMTPWIAYPDHQAPVMVTDALRNEQLAEMPAKRRIPVQPPRKSSIGYFLHKSLGNAVLHESPSEIPRQIPPNRQSPG